MLKKKSPLDEETPVEHNIPATSELLPTRNLLQTYTLSKLQKEQGGQTFNTEKSLDFQKGFVTWHCQMSEWKPFEKHLLT